MADNGQWAPPAKGTYTKDGSYVIHESDRQSGGRVVRRVLDPDTGLIKEVQWPAQHSQRWIDPSGNVVLMPVQGNRCRPHADHYYFYITRKKMRKGWLPYDTVPERHVQSQTIEEWAVEREQIIANRKEQHRKQQGQFGASFEPVQDKILKGTAEGIAQAMGQLIAEMRKQDEDAAVERPRRGRPPKDE